MIREPTLLAACTKVCMNIRNVLDADVIAVFQKDKSRSILRSAYISSDFIEGVKRPLGYSSLVNYVGLKKKPLIVKDIHDKAGLESIHPRLRYSDSIDKLLGVRCYSVIAVPVMVHDCLIGVLWAGSYRPERTFAEKDLDAAGDVAGEIALRLQFEMEVTREPFEYLVTSGILAQEILVEMEKKAAGPANLSANFSWMERMSPTPPSRNLFSAISRFPLFATIPQ